MSQVVVPYRFTVRRGTAANLATVNEVPLSGEFVLETDTRKIKMGDGTTRYNDLPYTVDAPTLATLLVGLVFTDDTPITSADSVIEAFGKLQAQINDINETGLPPYQIADGARYFVPDGKQALFCLPINIDGDGILDVSGALVEVH